jgi:hypothetical protein
MNNTTHQLPARAGICGGLLTVLLHIQVEELAKSALLAAVGTAVSFSVTLLLKWLFRRVQKRG